MDEADELKRRPNLLPSHHVDLISPCRAAYAGTNPILCLSAFVRLAATIMARNDHDPMFPHLPQLPMELVLEISRIAAISGAREGQYRSVANLLSLSKTFYRVVRPILYRKLVVSYSLNMRIVKHVRSTLAASPSLPPPLRGVHELHIYCPLTKPDIEAYASALVPAELDTVFVPFALIEALADQRAFLPRVLSVQFTTLRNLRTLPKTSLASVTHVCAHFPWLYSSQFQWPAVYGANEMGLTYIFKDLPALTHVALLLVEPKTRMRNIQTTVILNSLRYTLSLSRIQCVVVRVAGTYISFRDDIAASMLEINDTRLSCEYDERPLSNWDEYNVFRFQDALEEVDVWSTS